jgi:hypothetical protein
VTACDAADLTARGMSEGLTVATRLPFTEVLPTCRPPHCHSCSLALACTPASPTTDNSYKTVTSMVVDFENAWEMGRLKGADWPGALSLVTWASTSARRPPT